MRSIDPENSQPLASTSTSSGAALLPFVKPEPTDDDVSALNGNGKRERSRSVSIPPPPEASDRSPSPTAGGEAGANAGIVVMGTSSPALASSSHPRSPLLITVGGSEKPFDDVTEEDQELMTPDEYTVRPLASAKTCPVLLLTQVIGRCNSQAYFEVWSSLNDA